MEPSSSSSNSRGWERGQTSCIYRWSKPESPNLEYRIQWCMTLFNSLDCALTDLIASTMPRLRRHDDRLAALKEKMEVIASWFIDSHMNEEMSTGDQLGARPSACITKRKVDPISSVQVGDSSAHVQAHVTDSRMEGGTTSMESREANTMGGLNWQDY